MSNRRYPPAYLRYLKARLLNFSKPAFWGTAIFLSVLGLVIREYWVNPEAFTRRQSSEVTTQNTDDSLSAEDKAIAADIDNLPVLYNDVEQATGPITIRSSQENPRANQGKNLLQTLINQQKSSKNNALNPSLDSSNSSLTGDKNPFVTQTENLLQFGTQNSITQPLANSSQPQGVTGNPYAVGVGVNQIQKNPYTSSPSPSIPQPSTSNFNGGAASPSNSLGQTSYNGVPQNLSIVNGTPSILSNPAGQTVYNGVPQNLPTNSPTYVPNTNLNTGTGYIQPTVPNLSPNSYNGVNSVQPLPNQAPTSAVTSPVNSAIPTYTQPYSVQSPYANINSNQITPPTPASYTNSNYGYLRNQLPQSNFSVPGQSTGGVQGNPYGY
jgi:hypothetical protein